MGKWGDKRREKKTARKLSRKNRRADKRAFKLEKKTIRRSKGMQRILSRAETKQSRIENRAETKQTAFENGIDPNAGVWKGIAGVTDSIGNTVKSAVGSQAIGTAVGGLFDSGSSNSEDGQKKGFFDRILTFLGL
tara:strand:+ start:91 stop:495 length:405 start_codon:yes stop_codon:yes gene_type:complete